MSIGVILVLVVVSAQIRYIFRDVAVLRFDEPQDVQVYITNIPIHYNINYDLAHHSGIETHDRYLATSGGESVQLQQGRESGKGDVTEESATFVVAAKEEANHREYGARKIQNHARGITRKGKLSLIILLLRKLHWFY